MVDICADTPPARSSITSSPAAIGGLRTVSGEAPNGTRLAGEALLVLPAGQSRVRPRCERLC